MSNASSGDDQPTVDLHATHEQSLADVTRALLESEKTYRLVFSHELDAMSLSDASTGKLLDVNDAWLRLYGYSRDEALNMSVFDVSAEPQATRAAMDGPSAARIAVRWHRAKDGTVFPVELTCGKLAVAGRNLAYAMIRDITHRRDAERALQRSEGRFRALIESVPDAVVVHRDGKIVYMNPSARAMLRFTLDEDVGGVPVLSTVHPEDRAHIEQRIAEVLTHGKPTPLIEKRLLRRDGSSVVVEVSALRTELDGEDVVLAIARDVTARKAMEAQLVMNDRLASLGRLSACVGHELNNPLAYVLGNVTLLQRELRRASLRPDIAERCTEYLRTIEEGAQRMRHIVNDLKMVARADDDELVLLDVHQVLDACANIAEHELVSRARLVKDYRCRAFVRGSGARLGQVFLNLLVNAAEAIPRGNVKANEVRITVEASSELVTIEISDSGIGIRPSDRDRIFEPFFTTKEGMGTGLGLSISHGIVTGLGGTITAEPRPDRGSVFRVVLPSADANASADATGR